MSMSGMTGQSNENSLWMGDIDAFMDEQYILNAYKALGEEAVRVKFVKDKKTGARAYFCFVIFRDKAQASRVLQVLNGKAFPQNPNKRFKLNFAQYGKDFAARAYPRRDQAGTAEILCEKIPKCQSCYSSPEFSLYVGELTPDVTDIMLLGFFAKKYQATKEAKVVVDNLGKSRGYGFVRFYNEHEQSMAQQQMNGAKGLGGRAIRVSKATPKIAQQIDKAFQTYSNTMQIPTTSNASAVKQNQSTTYESASAIMELPICPRRNRRQIDRAFQNYSNTVQIPTTGNLPSVKQTQPTNYESDYAFPGFFTHWNNYNHCYYSQTTAPLNPDTKNDDDVLEDPTLTVDIDRMNMEFIDKSEEFYLAIEDSRWFAIDSNTTTYDDLIKK